MFKIQVVPVGCITFLLLAITVSGLLCPGAHAGEAASLGTIVVTATRSGVPEQEVPSVVDVIGQEEIQATVAADLTDVLKKNTSIDVIQYPGALSGISIRGFRPEFSGITKHSLLLIDGRPAGATNLSTILAGNIERIEVLKGPASSLYGAEAMGGVINVITRRSTGGLNGSIYGETGSFDTWNGGVRAGGKIFSMLDFDLTASSRNRNSDMEMGNHHGTRPGTTYSIGYGSLRLGSSIAQGWRLDVKGDWYYGNDIETPGALYYFDRQRSRKDIERYGGDARLEGVWGLHKTLVTLYASEESSDYYKRYAYDRNSGGYVKTDPYHSYYSQTTWWGIQTQDTYALMEAHSITLGIDYQEIEQESRSYNQDGSRRAPWQPDNKRENWAGFVETMWRFLDERLIITAGGRYDYFDVETKKTPFKTDFHPGSETFDTFSPRAGIRYNLVSGLSFHSTIGKAFVPPTADQMAGYSERQVGDTTMITRGNPDLDPETSWTWDLGVSLERPESGMSSDITWFVTEVDDKITRVTHGNTTTFANSSEAEIAGLEFKARWDLGKLLGLGRKVELFVDGTRLFHAREKVEGEGWNDIHNVAHWKVNYGIRYDDGLLDGSITARYMGKRKDYDWYSPGYPEIEYPDFNVVDLQAGITVRKHHHLGLKVTNLFDTFYYEKPEFPLEGRAWYLRYTYEF